MKKVRCNLAFRGYTKQPYLDFCTGVSGGIYTNAGVFVTPPFHKDEYDAVLSKYIDAAKKYKDSPKIEKTNYDNAKGAMTGVLNKTAEYVDSIALSDASIIILAGYVPTKSAKDKSKPLEANNDFKPVRTATKGKVTVTINAYKVPGTIWYFCLCTENGDLPASLTANGVLDFTNLPEGALLDLSKNRKKEFTNLASGKTYYFYVFASNTVSVSPLSDPQLLDM